jgi:hypothetical protein
VLYVNYSGQDQGELVRKLTEEFNDVIVPLIPLHIVFDGFMFYLEFSVTARECVLTMSGADVTTRIDDAFKARAEHMADFQINNVFPGQNLPQQVRSLAPELHRFDQMPVDAWALDLVQLRQYCLFQMRRMIGTGQAPTTKSKSIRWVYSVCKWPLWEVKCRCINSRRAQRSTNYLYPGRMLSE